MKRFTAYVIFLVVLIALVSYAALFVPKPEEEIVVSDDGVLTLTGVTRTSQPFLIDISDMNGGGVLEDAYYIVQPRGIVLEEPVTLMFDVSGFEKTPSVFRYSEPFMMWKAVSADSIGDGELLLVTDRLGMFALGNTPDIEAPTFVSQEESLIGMAPEGTTSFTFATGYSLDGAPTILLPESERIGGCSGQTGKGSTEEHTLFEENLIIPVDGKDTLVTFSFVAQWFVSDNGGCAEGENLETR